jgi:hypothetical protein
MTRQLVLVHGRAQQRKDAIALKREWLEALREGLAKSDLVLPISENDVRFPFYGDTLSDMVSGLSPEEAAEVVVRGAAADAEQKRFISAVLEEVQRKTGITDAEIAAVAGEDVAERGPQHWEWVHAFLKAVDRFVPHGSGASIALFTRDVYSYLKNEVIRRGIEEGVASAITPGVETIVVSHSLGTVVSYNVLRREGRARGWNVPLFVTLGSPLAITEIRRALRSAGPARCPECVRSWFNALDERDVVALYPLDTSCFPLDPSEPAIVNKTDVRNRTPNRHGSDGYLDDEDVACRIYDALTRDAHNHP